MDSNSCFISVVIPAHNEEQRLAAALSGLLNQVVNPTEVIVVDNCSTDTTKYIAQSFAGKFRRKKIDYYVLSETNLGSAFARNKGFYAAKFPLIASMDADIVPHSNWIKNIHEHFLQHDSVAVSGITIIKDSSLLVLILSAAGWYKYLTMLLKLIFGFQTITTANAAVRSDVFKTVGGFNTKCVNPDQLDDTELSKRLSLHGSIRIDTNIRVDGSFRRYQPISKAITSSFQRLYSWYLITNKKRKIS